MYIKSGTADMYSRRTYTASYKKDSVTMIRQKTAVEDISSGRKKVKTITDLQRELAEKIMKMIEKFEKDTLGGIPMNSIGTEISQMSVNGGNTTQWTRIELGTESVEEEENTTFSSQGQVHTADGRTINFKVSFEMSRSFSREHEFFSQNDYITTDPLVINMDSNMASVSDQKFYFDLDADGKKEEISMLGAGSGFLALDKNGDGKINDGKELFGTRTGDGFAELAAYDEDGNGWIDEADSVYSKLRVWCKNDDGTDKLLTLKQADAGAIYLGYASTQFHLNNRDTNQTNGIIQQTGIYLTEAGDARTIQHVDFVV